MPIQQSRPYRSGISKGQLAVDMRLDHYFYMSFNNTDNIHNDY